MSQTVVQLLRYIKELPPGDSDLGLMKLDLERALTKVEFTEDEANALRALFLVEPTAPERGRLDKTGGTAGRPRGGQTAKAVAEMMMADKSDNARRIRMSRLVHSAAEKVAEFLGEDYA